MWKSKVHEGPRGDDAGRVDSAMALVVVPLDVPHIDGVGHTWYLIKIAQVAGQVRVIGDAAQVALEVTDISHIKP